MATQYRYLLADVLTNQILAELSLTNVNFTQQLNAAGTCTGEILLSGVNSAALNVLNSTIPGRCALYIDRNGILVWGGIIWNREWDSPTQLLKLTAREFESYFERRRITQTTPFTGVEQFTIVESLINQAQGVAYGNIGVVVPITTSATTALISNAVSSGSTIVYTTSAINYFQSAQTITVTGIKSTGNPSGAAGTGFNQTGTVTIISTTQFSLPVTVSDTYVSGGSAVNQGVIIGSQIYYSYELKTYFSAISDLAKSNNGFDFNIAVAYDGDGNPTKTLQLGYPRLGNTYSATSSSVPVFILPAGNIVKFNYKEDGSKAVNSMYATGAGSNEGKLIANYQDSTKTLTGWPLLEDVMNYSNITDPVWLTGLATGQTLAASYPPQTIQVVAPPYLDPVYGTYHLGDQARLIITDNFYPNEFDGNYRIIGINVTPGENNAGEEVTITLTTTTN
jgi:hypothetical protein